MNTALDFSQVILGIIWSVYYYFLKVPILGTWEFLHPVILVSGHGVHLLTLHTKNILRKECLSSTFATDPFSTAPVEGAFFMPKFIIQQNFNLMEEI